MNTVLNWIKQVVFEEGKLIYNIDIPRRRRAKKNIEKKARKEKIHVGIILQDTSAWDTILPVYRKMLEDNDFDVKIILVPQVSFKWYLFLNSIDCEKVYRIGATLSKDYIKAYDEINKKWVDLEEYDFDYMFYMIPYETYLPKNYRAHRLSQFTKVCYVPYANPLIGDYNHIYNSHFVRNVYLAFCETEAGFDYLKRFKRGIKTGILKPQNCGYPRYDLLTNHEEKESCLWKNKRDNKRLRIIWTPRWTSYSHLGGSNFLKYKDIFLDYVKENDDIDFVFRPHPMTFEHHVSVGLLTEEQLEGYCKQYEVSKNAALDLNREYFDTFFTSDVLVTDVSSVVWDYLFTGKPVILCPSSPISYNIPQALSECVYIAESFEGIQRYINDLRREIDPLKEKRNQLSKELKRSGDIAGDIVDVIKKDYR